MDLIRYPHPTEAQQDRVNTTTCRLVRQSLTISTLGKTLLARTLARVLDVPFSVSDATSFTQVRVTLFRSCLILTTMFPGGMLVNHARV
jgi:hypothetical protein